MSKTDGHLYIHPVSGKSTFIALPPVAVAFIPKVTEFFLMVPVQWKSHHSGNDYIKSCEKSRVKNSSPDHRPQCSILCAGSRSVIVRSSTRSKHLSPAPLPQTLIAEHGFMWHGISLSSLCLSQPGCTTFQFLGHLQPTH